MKIILPFTFLCILNYAIILLLAYFFSMSFLTPCLSFPYTLCLSFAAVLSEGQAVAAG